YSGGGGVEGARILLDNDREATTNADGRVEFAALLDGEHLVSLDPRSLGKGERPGSSDSVLVRLWDGSSEEVVFLVVGRPVLGLKLEREGAPVDTIVDAHRH